MSSFVLVVIGIGVWLSAALVATAALRAGAAEVDITPKEWPLLYPIPARTSFVASEVNVLDPDFEPHPLARYARGWEAVIEPGDILYLPAYTWHAVENPEPAISVNLLWHDNARSMRALPLAFFNWRFMQDDSKGTADQFLEEQLKPEIFQKACDNVGHPLELRMQEGYDHSYYFVSSFMEDHLRWHADILRAV